MYTVLNANNQQIIIKISTDLTDTQGVKNKTQAKGIPPNLPYLPRCNLGATRSSYSYTSYFSMNVRALARLRTTYTSCWCSDACSSHKEQPRHRVGIARYYVHQNWGIRLNKQKGGKESSGRTSSSSSLFEPCHFLEKKIIMTVISRDHKISEIFDDMKFSKTSRRVKKSELSKTSQWSFYVKMSRDSL